MEVNWDEASAHGRDVALPAVSLGFLLVLFDATAVNVATGEIGRSLGASVTSLQWVLDAYTVAFAATMLGAGHLGDRLGARRVYVAGSALFALAAAGCALAPGAPALIAARAVQGVGAAAVVPCSLAIIADRYPDGAARGRALAVWGGVSGVGLAAGPVVGGALIALAGWRAVFVVVVPLALASAAIVAAGVPETPQRSGDRADLPGQVLVAAALVAATGSLIQGPTLGWSDPRTLGLASLAVLLGAAFALRERRTAAPMVPPALLSSRRLRAMLGVGLLFNFGLYGSLFCLALALERTLREPGQIAGLSLLPLTVVVALGALLSGRLMGRLGPRAPMFVGLAGGLLGASLLAVLGTYLGTAGLAGMGAVLGLVGFAMPAMTAVALAAVDPRRAALGAALLNSARQAGGALGVALLGGLLVGHATAHDQGSAPTHLSAPMLVVAAGYLAALILTATMPTAARTSTTDVRHR